MSSDSVFMGNPYFHHINSRKNGRLVWWRCNERAECQRMLQAFRKRSNGHTWRSHSSVQHIKTGCERSTSGGTDFGWSPIAQWRKFLFVDGCEWKNPLYTATDSLNPCQDVVYASGFSWAVLRIACLWNIWATFDVLINSLSMFRRVRKISKNYC